MSRDETERFRITPWPSSLHLPPAVAVPRFVGVFDCIWDDAPPDQQFWVDLGTLTDRLDVVGPTQHNPASGEPIDRDLDLQAKLYVDPAFRAYLPGCEDGLIDAGYQLDYPPALIVDNQPPDLKEIPDELFLREFLTLNADDVASVVGFVDQWGPLIEPATVEHADVVQLVPRPWSDYMREHYDRGPRGPMPDDPEVEALLAGEATVDELREHRRVRGASLLDETALATSLDPLDAKLDQPWRVMTEQRHELFQQAVMEESTVEEGEDHAYTLPSDGRRIFSVRTYALGRQMWLARVFQAVFESWILLDADHDLDPDRLALPPRDQLLDVWTRRRLPAPTTAFEAVSTIQTMVNEATTALGPRIELTHPQLEARGGAYGRPVPRVLSAMCLQLLAWVAEGVPARRCANETCSQWFSRQRGRAESGQYRTSGVLYCSSSCAKAQSQRAYRRRNRGHG